MIWNQEELRNSEAREWLRRYRDKVNDLGAYEARQWWLKMSSDIARIRGKSAADDLKARMNRIKNEIRSQG